MLMPNVPDHLVGEADAERSDDGEGILRASVYGGAFEQEQNTVGSFCRGSLLHTHRPTEVEQRRSGAKRDREGRRGQLGVWQGHLSM